MSDYIYVREKGQLRRVGDIVLVETKSASCGKATSLVRKEHFVFSYNAEGSLRYSAKSLYDISLLFVADNIHHVDSLVGFPEQIGTRLFDAAEEKHVFQNPDTATKALQLFSAAYGQMVLRSLCLRDRFPLLSERIHEIKTFNGLISLDLFGCRLGDSHDIFQHLTSDLLTSLVKLYIGGNNLSNVGVQRLTAPVRMMKKGLRNLELLDLSYNPISEQALGYLSCLPKLQSLDLSGTNLKLCPSLKKSLWDLRGLVHSERPMSVFDHSHCKTEGWAEQIINQWETNATKTQNQRNVAESRTAARHFYGRQKFVREVLTAAPLLREKDEDDKGVRMQFCKPATASHAPQMKLSAATFSHTESPCISDKKRQRKSEGDERQRISPPAKRLSPNALTQEDMDLLNSY